MLGFSGFGEDEKFMMIDSGYILIRRVYWVFDLNGLIKVESLLINVNVILYVELINEIFV